MKRLVIVAEEKDIQLGRSLVIRATEIARQVNAQNVVSLIGERTLHFVESKDEKLASEIILWARDGGKFTAAWTSVSPSSDVVDVVQAESELGLVAEIFSSESGRSLEEPILQASSFTNLGERRGKPVQWMRGLPVQVFGHCMAVLTAVGYETTEDLDFSGDNEVSKLALSFGQFAELKLLKMCAGLDEL